MIRYTSIWITVVMLSAGIALVDVFMQGPRANAQVVLSAEPADGEAPDRVDPQDATERLLVYTPDGPLIVDVTITIRGEPYRVFRERLIDELLAYAGTGDDGVVMWDVALANPRFAYGRLRGIAGNPQQRQQMIQRFDTDDDGEIDRDELRRMISQYVGGPVFTLNDQIASAGTAIDLFAFLDTNGNDQLDADELATLKQRLQQQDANDDEWIDITELGGTPAGYGGTAVRLNAAAVATVRIQAYPQVVEAESASAIHLPADFDRSILFAKLLAWYPPADRLPQSEADARPLMSVFVASLDTNDDGRVSRDELGAITSLPAHVAMQVNLGKTDDATAALGDVQLSPEMQDWIEADREGDEQVVLRLPSCRLLIDAADFTPQYNFLQQASRILTFLDQDNNGYLDSEELETPQAQAYASYFEASDTESDGKIDADEIAAGLEKMQSPMRDRASVSVGLVSDPVVAAIDANDDNRFSLREVQEAADCLLQLDGDSDGAVQRTEIPSVYRLLVARGQNYSRYYSRLRLAGRASATSPSDRETTWFSAMDHNGDGDVSPREFLGTDEQFTTLDADGDDLISATEASVPSADSGE